MRATADHVLLTRFNLPSGGVESLIRAKDGWLRNRVALFERYTVPSVQAQTLQAFRWLVYFDPESPAWLHDWIGRYERRGVFTPMFRQSVSAADITSDADRLTGRAHPDLITTNLDNDDGLALDFVERLHNIEVRESRAALYLSNGLILSPDGLYLRRDRLNAFCSVREEWADPVTCWTNWHNLLPETMPAVRLAGNPGWLQVVHGANVSNRVRGRLVSPSRYRELFADQIADVRDPGQRRLLLEYAFRQPIRSVKEGARAVAKRMVMEIGGKDGLARVKNVLAARVGADQETVR